MSVRSVVGRAARPAAKAVFAAADVILPQFVGPRLLIYHQIGAGLGRQMEVTEVSFQAQLDWLADHTQVVDLATAIAGRGTSGTRPLVVLTFDDGYEDLYRLGFPLLASCGVPFTVYLTTEPIETGVPLGPRQARPLTWPQIEEMLSTGLMTLGVHTHRHPDLRFMAQSRVTEELAASDAIIQARLGAPPRHFAYPYGYWSAAADVEVRNRYESAVLGAGASKGSEMDPFLLHRIPIQLSDGLFFFRRKVRSGMRLEESARRVVTGYRGP